MPAANSWHSFFKEKGYSAQEIDAVLALHPARVLEIPARLEAVRSFSAMAQAESLAAANKRIGNILKKSPAASDEVKSDFLQLDAEKALYAALCDIEPKVNAAYEKGAYTDVLTQLATLREPVDQFFEDVMVNVDDETLRANRLALLARLHRTMNQVAELSRLAK